MLRSLVGSEMCIRDSGESDGSAEPRPTVQERVERVVAGADEALGEPAAEVDQDGTDTAGESGTTDTDVQLDIDTDAGAADGSPDVSDARSRINRFEARMQQRREQQAAQPVEPESTPSAVEESIREQTRAAGAPDERVIVHDMTQHKAKHLSLIHI